MEEKIQSLESNFVCWYCSDTMSWIFCSLGLVFLHPFFPLFLLRMQVCADWPLQSNFSWIGKVLSNQTNRFCLHCSYECPAPGRMEVCALGRTAGWGSHFQVGSVVFFNWMKINITSDCIHRIHRVRIVSNCDWQLPISVPPWAKDKLIVLRPVTEL